MRKAVTSDAVARIAARVLNDKKSSNDAKIIAGSVLAQVPEKKPKPKKRRKKRVVKRRKRRAKVEAPADAA